MAAGAHKPGHGLGVHAYLPEIRANLWSKFTDIQGVGCMSSGRLKLIVCFASKFLQNPMREGGNTAQTPGKSTGLFHCHLALDLQS